VRWTRAEEVAALLVSCAAILGSVVLLTVRRPAPPVEVIAQAPAATVVVQVDGEVLRPGIYQLPVGARARDAIRAAGGPSPLADATAVNQARLLRDGDRLTLPARSASAVASEGSRVLLNTAGEAELISLPGIGPVLAQRIIAHRQREGPYQRLEDLLQVEGIGPKLLERLRPLVTVE
jgi:competence protein ComEA